MRTVETGQIRFCHVRNYGEDGQVLPFGGLTVAFTRLDDDKVAASLSICSDRDNFSKKVGRMISQGRLLSSKDGLNHVIETKVKDIYALKSIVSNWALKSAYGA